MAFENDSQFTDNVLLHMSAALRRRDMTVSREIFACCYGQHFWVKKVGESRKACRSIYNKVREPDGSLLFHVKHLMVACEANLTCLPGRGTRG